MSVPYKVVEIDPEVIHRLRCDGATCIYGDASNIHVLSHAGLKRAMLLVVTLPDPMAMLTTVKAALSIKHNLKIIARVHRAREAKLLKKLGVEELLSPEYQASLEFLRRILSLTGWRKADIDETLPMVACSQENTKFDSDGEGWRNG